MFNLVLKLPMALGNGNRQMGEVLATCDGITPNELQANAHELVGNELAQLPGTITPSSGVTPYEVLTALRNPHLCEFTSVSEEAPVAESESTSEEELAPESRPKRPESRPKKK